MPGIEAERGGAEVIDSQVKISQILYQEAELETSLDQLAQTVGNHVINVMSDVRAGSGLIPDEVAPLTSLHVYLNDLEHSYLDKDLTPAIEGGYPYQSSDKIAQARLAGDIGILTLYFLGGRAPRNIFEAVLERKPLGLTNDDLNMNDDAFVYDGLRAEGISAQEYEKLKAENPLEAIRIKDVRLRYKSWHDPNLYHYTLY